MKQCIDCGESKDECEFYRDYCKEDGLSRTCVKCYDKRACNYQEQCWKKVNKQTQGQNRRNVNRKRFKIIPHQFNPELRIEELCSQFKNIMRPSWIVKDLSQFEKINVRDESGRLYLPDMFVPNVSGCYAWVDKSTEEVLYIGKASALRSRIRQHFSEQKYSLRPGCLMEEICDAGYEPYICVWQCQVPQNALLEMLLVHFYTPKFNREFE